MNGQQNQQQNQQQGQQHDPVDPVANRPVHNSSSSSVRDTIGLKSSEILNWLNAYFNAKPFTMVFCILLAIICGIFLYGIFRPALNPSNPAEAEKFHSKIVQLLVQGNAQMELKKLQNEIIDEFSAIIEEQAKELDELRAKHGNGKGGQKGNKKEKELLPMEETRYRQIMFNLVVIFKFTNIICIIVMTLSACKIAYDEFIRPHGWDIRKWGWDTTIHFINGFSLYVLMLFLPFISLYIFYAISNY